MKRAKFASCVGIASAATVWIASAALSSAEQARPGQKAAGAGARMQAVASQGPTAGQGSNGSPSQPGRKIEAGPKRTATRAASMPEPKITKEGAAFFENKIRPALVHYCYECHSGDPGKAKAHFVVDTRDGMRRGGDSGVAFAPGHSDGSSLIEALRYEGLMMPPKAQLPEEIVADFVSWIDMGAPDPRSGKAANPKNKIDLAEARKYWAFKPPKAVKPPAVKDSAWPRTDVDRFLLARLEQEQLDHAPDADRATLVRRVSFDLTGLPPTPEEIDAFVADKTPSAFEKVVDRLLASPQFGERWGRHWLDVARYGESSGRDRNLPYRYAWRYRNYVIDALNQDKPFDRFIVEQLAGDLLPAKNSAESDRLETATGFLAIGPKAADAVKPEQFRMDEVDDQIDATCRGFLGMTVACARCHDHKFDPIPTADYYAMAGIFHSSQTYSGIAPGRKTALDERLVGLKSARSLASISPDDVKAEQQRRQEIDSLTEEIKELRNPPKAAKDKPGKKQSGSAVRTNPLAGKKGDGKDRRAEIKELEEKRDELAAVPVKTVELAMGVHDAEAPANVNVLGRGDLANKGPEAPRGVLTVLRTAQTPQIGPRHSGRLELAHWIASRDNPLTARVFVNRVWSHLFSDGLVDTVDNFGALGNEPSHPELLDALAAQFMDQNWSTKKLIRSLVLTRAYQMSSRFDEAAGAKDPANRLMWRMSPRRLDAEEIRDAMLAACGQLKLDRPEGSPMLEANNKNIAAAKNAAPGDVRSVYLAIPRNGVPESLQAFDMADPDLILGKRDVTTSPTQALFLLNNPLVLRCSEQMARRLLGQKELNSAARIELAYRLTLGRRPSEDEAYTVGLYLKEYRDALEAHPKSAQTAAVAAWASFCQTLFATGEFRYAY